jgi:thiol-disulfide isomerase/thioredoxin
MRQKYTWLLVLACLIALVPATKATCTEHRVAVKTIDSAGIDQLIKASKGTVILAMAAWCLPCREELPILVKLYDKYKSQGLKVIGISLDLDGPSAILPILDKANVNFPVFWAGEKTANDFNIRAIPMLLLIKDGSIVETVLGRRPEAFLDVKISDLLKKEK